MTSGGFVYGKDEMLDVYKLGKFREMDFAEKFAHAANATTPETLIPLALVPLASDEIELRKNSTLGPMQQVGGRGGGKGFGEREGGKGGRGKGEGGKGERGGKGRAADGEQWQRGERYSNEGGGRNVRADRRDARPSNGSDDGGHVPPNPPLPNLPVPPPAKDWFYRDLEGTVQGPFAEAQISEWHTAGYLPADLQMRTADEPDSAYIALSELMSRDPNGEPPFLKVHRERTQYEAERERLKAQWEQMKAQEEERKRARAAAEEEKRLQRAHALEQQRLQQEQLNAQRLAQGAPAEGLPPPPGKGLPPPPASTAMAQQLLEEERRKGAEGQQRLAQEHARMLAAQEAQRQADAEMHRKMLEQARREAEEAARAQVEEARRQTEMMQMQMKAQAEQLARQQAEVQAQQLQQQEELARRQAAMEEQQRLLEQQRQQAEEQERQLAMLPPANAPGAGNALLSLLQSSDAGLPQQQLDTSSLDALWAQDMPGGNNGEVGFGRGRGRGRGVCSAALGTGAQRPKFGRGGSGDGLGLEGLQLDQPGGLPGMGEPPSGGGAHLVEPEADDKGRKKKNKKEKGGKGGGEAPREDICDDHDEQPGSQLPAWGGGWGDAPSNAPAAVYAADRPAASASMAEIQAEEEKARAADQKQRAAAASAQAEADWQRPMGSVWGGNHAQQPRQAQPAPARAAAAAPQPPQQSSQPKSFAQLARAGAQQPQQQQRSAEAQAALKAAGLDDDAMLWDYGGREAEILGPAAAAAAAPAKQPKKKKGGAAAEQPESPARTNGRAPSQPAEAPQDDAAADSAFGVGEGNMPPAMSRWCQEQMLALTGNDDTTLTHFLFSLENDDEIVSYLSMYLGDTPTVRSFAREFALRKKAARGLGESRDWQKAGRGNKGKDSDAAPEEDSDGFTQSKSKRKSGKKGKSLDPTMLGFSVESSRIMQGEVQLPS